MKKFVFIARAGQGAKSAANILAKAAFLQGLNVQEFPEYGPERMGAPVKSYVKIGNKKIRDFSPITKADYVVLIDKTLINLALGLDLKDSILIINDVCDAEKYYKKYKINAKIGVVNASKISFKNIGLDKPSIPMLGAVLSFEKMVKNDSINRAVREYFEGFGKKNVVDSNIKAIKECYEGVNK
ncbi:MAG: 2-oxoacid:acceptor oxidoreductase family protein [Candidatus Nanoarchaeia archaeon]|nr:2-oxoacid:acceptor oxidoreductase family protein [Candidatus Nanoarchaeia archaeon]MDD5054261.1 2-oxoacid:acceptor oxidoreductase family protein [Candidatus Nanoarchaeia archaeon]MDD5499630.1 2-oxoacid:acceptor oxidoreductase family protein [Candidatus Nanoarchaeia archaeon]